MRVLVIDDHPLFRVGLKALLCGLDPGLLTDDAGTVAEAAAWAADGHCADLVLLDMNLPGTRRLDAVRQIKAIFEAAPVVVVSADEDPALIRSAIDAGAAGYVPKTSNAAITIQALRLVLANGIYLPPIALGAPHGVDARSPADMSALSVRQRNALQRLLQGKPNKVIAREMGIAEGTVKAHLWAVYQMLGVTSRAQAMYRAHELGLFAPTD